MPKRTQWTKARVAQLLELNEAGLTAASIADELTKTFVAEWANDTNRHRKFAPSRSAVIGKLDRLGLKLGQARAKPVAPAAPAHPQIKRRTFDCMWWASLSHREQVKILTMRTVEMVSGYAAASKRRFIDSNSLG